jgi:hypothetical protein
MSGTAPAPADEAAPPARSRRLGLVLCAIAGAYFFISPIYALLHYADFASALPQLLRYVVAPAAIGLALLAVGYFARPGLSAIVGLCSVCVLASLFAFEAMLTLRQLPIHFANLGQVPEGQPQQSGLVRSFTLRRLNNLAGTESLETMMFSGFPASDVLLCAPEGRTITYKADRYGFNNPDEIYDAPIELMLLGDSFVEGFCLPRGADIASRLRSHGINTASLGIRGNGPLLELAALGRFGPVMKPKRVVMAFFEGNDWENLRSELRFPNLQAALRQDADFGTLQTAQATAVTAMRKIRETEGRRFTIIDLLQQKSILRNFAALQMTGTSLGLVYPKVSPGIPEFVDTLRRGKALAAGWGGEFALLYVPRVDRFMGAFPSDAPFDQLRDIVHAAAADADVEIIDLREALRRYPDPETAFAPDAHFSPQGAAFAAETIACRLAADKSVAMGIQGCETTAAAE